MKFPLAILSFVLLLSSVVGQITFAGSNTNNLGSTPLVKFSPAFTTKSICGSTITNVSSIFGYSFYVSPVSGAFLTTESFYGVVYLMTPNNNGTIAANPLFSGSHTFADTPIGWSASTLTVGSSTSHKLSVPIPGGLSLNSSAIYYLAIVSSTVSKGYNPTGVTSSNPTSTRLLQNNPVVTSVNLAGVTVSTFGTELAEELISTPITVTSKSIVSTLGGTFNISGLFATTVTAVTINGVACPISTATSTLVTCNAPAGHGSNLALAITNSLTTYTTNTFTYIYAGIYVAQWNGTGLWTNTNNSRNTMSLGSISNPSTNVGQCVNGLTASYYIGMFIAAVGPANPMDSFNFNMYSALADCSALLSSTPIWTSKGMALPDYEKSAGGYRMIAYGPTTMNPALTYFISLHTKHATGSYNLIGTVPGLTTYKFLASSAVGTTVTHLTNAAMIYFSPYTPGTTTGSSTTGVSVPASGANVAHFPGTSPWGNFNKSSNNMHLGALADFRGQCFTGMTSMDYVGMYVAPHTAGTATNGDSFVFYMYETNSDCTMLVSATAEWSSHVSHIVDATADIDSVSQAYKILAYGPNGLDINKSYLITLMPHFNANPYDLIGVAPAVNRPWVGVSSSAGGVLTAMAAQPMIYITSSP